MQSFSGSGGFGRVELSWLTDPDGKRKKVAVKRYHQKALMDDLNLKLLISEIDIMMKAQHK